MDSNGNFYANEQQRKILEDIMAAQVSGLRRELEQVRPIEQAPADAIDVDEGAAVALAQMNRRQRMVFYSERGHGKNVEEALQAARESLPK